MNEPARKLVGAVFLAVVLAISGLLVWHYSIRNGRKYAESVHGIVLPPSASNIQTRRSGLGFKYWGTDNYVVSVFHMDESEFTPFTASLPIVTRHNIQSYHWPGPFEGFRAVPTEFIDKHAMIDFSSPTGDGLRCYAWKTGKGLFVRLTTAFF